MKLKNILAENMLRFGTKNLSTAQRNWINEAGTEYTNCVAMMYGPRPLASKSYEYGDVIPLDCNAVVYSSAPFKVAFTSFTPSIAGKVMGFTTKSYISADKTFLGWSITGTGRTAVLAKTAGTTAELNAYPKEGPQKEVAQSLQNIIGDEPGAAKQLLKRSAANGWTDYLNSLDYQKTQLVVPQINYNMNIGSLKQMASTPSGAQFLAQNYNAAFFNKISKYGKVPEDNFYKGGVVVGTAVFTTNDSTAQTMSKKIVFPSTTSIGVGAFAGTTTKP